MQGNRQKKSWSFFEVALGRTLGFISAMILQQTIFPIYAWSVTWQQSAEITLIFTAVSMTLSFLIRITFEWLHSKGIGVTKEK